MAISQADRDRLEDLQLDPLGDHTEILTNKNDPGSAPTLNSGALSSTNR